MRYPEFTNLDYPRPAHSVEEGYIAFFAENEKDNRERLERSNHNSVYRAAMKIGRAIFIASDNEKAAMRMIAKTRRDLAIAEYDPESTQGREARQLNLLANIIEDRRDKATAHKHQQELHASAVMEVRGLRYKQQGLDPYSAEGGLVRGSLAHYAALGLLARYAHPYLLATPAMMHHDMSETSRSNFDILLVESMPQLEKPNTYKIQVKCECLGLCTERPEPRYAQKHYDSDITLVSACCDLQRGDGRSPELTNFRAADLLIKEYDGLANTDEIHELDSYTDSLLLSVTMGDERRMGTQ